ncbi:MAG: MBL fold metallo-hydrolase [Planctomycetes bacterium]|nr:MBL fold metallo-hydrolase [Planctomycetota bacterium]
MPNSFTHFKIIIHRGSHEIGGSCVELQASSGARILIDFGMPLQAPCGADFNDRSLEGKSTPTLIDEKVLFDIKGLYPGDTPSLDAVLISHSHKDHYGLLPYINPKIPVYISEGAYKLIQALNIFIPEHKHTVIDTPVFLKHRQPVIIGGFEITPHLVDHSGFDAMSFLITEISSGKTIFYTGDFLTGGWTHKRYDDVIINPPKQIDCMLMEGTMLERDGGKYPDEESVVQGVIEAIGKSANTVIPLYCSGQNIDRIVSLYKAARRAKALFVVDPYTACMLRVAGSVAHSSIPQVEWDGIYVFIANYGKGDKYVYKMSKSNHKEMIYSIGRKEIKAYDFGALKQKFLLLMRNSMIPVVEKIPQIKGSTLIYSQWEGYIKKQTPDAKMFWQFVERNDLKVEHIHAGGHAPVADLKRLADAIDPKVLIPIHTFKPQQYNQLFKNVRMLKDGEPFTIPTK